MDDDDDYYGYDDDDLRHVATIMMDKTPEIVFIPRTFLSISVLTFAKEAQVEHYLASILYGVSMGGIHVQT